MAFWRAQRGTSSSRKLVLILACLAPLAAPAPLFAQDADAVRLLRQAAATYRGLRSTLTSYEAHITVSTVDGATTSERHFTETGGGAAYRSEEDKPDGVVRVDDGHSAWVLDRKTNRYTKGPSSGNQPSYVSQLATIDQNLKDASVLREDLYTVDGKPVKVYIVEAIRSVWPIGTPAGAQEETIRIDEKTSEIYGFNVYGTGPTEIVQVSLVQRNQKVPDGFFAFTPPAGAKEVASLGGTRVETSSMLGSEAPDFTLADPSGRSYRLKDLRGKVVVIDFWASWCGPCRESMPYLRQIQQQYGASVEVLGVDGGEDANTVAAFARQQNYTFPLLVGGEPTVTTKYFLDSYPTTLVLDRNGRVAFRQNGTDGPTPLFAAVKSAVAKKN